MKLIDAINEADNLKPNMYGLPEKIKWLSRLDERIFENIIRTHVLSEEEMAPFLPETEQGEEETEEAADGWHPIPGPPAPPELVFSGYTEEDQDKELIVKSPYDELYVHWLCAQIDWYNREFGGFNASNAIFESTYTAFRNAFNQTHMPLGREKIYF